MGFLYFSHGFWWTLCDNRATAFSAFGAEVYNMVDRLYHVRIVLDDNHCVTGIYQAVEYDKQPSNVGEVETCSWFVQQVKRTAGVGTGEFGG